MPNFEQHDIQVAHDLGTLEGKVAAILQYTSQIPDIAKKVEKHENQLRFIRWAGVTSVGALISLVVAWFRAQFSTGR